MAESRVFFALWPDAATAAAIDKTADSLGCGGRRIARGRLHLTLEFVGTVQPTSIKALCRQAGAIEAPRFTLTLDEVGYFNKPQLLWLGPSSAPQAVTDLAAALGRMASHDSGTQPPPFRPHVSLAYRAKRPAAGARIQPIEWPVREFSLVESGRNGAPGGYSVLQRWPLG